VRRGKKFSDEGDYISAEDMVLKMKNFKSTKDIPSPNFMEGNELYDLAAVVAGSKPAAMIAKSDDCRLNKLVEMAKEYGFVVDDIEDIDPESGEKLGESYIIGKGENVENLKRLHLNAINAALTDPSLFDWDNYSREVGKNLGYNNDAIEDYIKALKEGRKPFLEKRGKIDVI